MDSMCEVAIFIWVVVFFQQEAYERQFCEISDDVYRPIIESAIPLHPSKIWNNIRFAFHLLVLCKKPFNLIV